MRRVLGALCMLLGLALLAGAGWMIYENFREDAEAGEQSAEMLAAMKEAIVEGAEPTEMEELEPDATLPPPEFGEMPTMMIDGEAYIGYIEMPTIDVYLPVMSQWSYERLKVAPCRYWGSVYDGSLVLLGHNYQRHFSRIKQLEVGDPVQFVDVNGEIYRYVVERCETLSPTAVEDMIEGNCDLTLFTCTTGGNMRHAVRCKRVLTY